MRSCTGARMPRPSPSPSLPPPAPSMTAEEEDEEWVRKVFEDSKREYKRQQEEWQGRQYTLDLLASGDVYVWSWTPSRRSRRSTWRSVHGRRGHRQRCRPSPHALPPPVPRWRAPSPELLLVASATTEARVLLPELHPAAGDLDLQEPRACARISSSPFVLLAGSPSSTGSPSPSPFNIRRRPAAASMASASLLPVLTNSCLSCSL